MNREKMTRAQERYDAWLAEEARWKEAKETAAKTGKPQEVDSELVNTDEGFALLEEYVNPDGTYSRRRRFVW